MFPFLRKKTSRRSTPPRPASSSSPQRKTGSTARLPRRPTATMKALPAKKNAMAHSTPKPSTTIAPPRQTTAVTTAPPLRTTAMTTAPPTKIIAAKNDFVLEFVSVKNGSIQDSLFMPASTKTSLGECAKWVAQHLGSQQYYSHSVTMSLGDFGLKTVSWKDDEVTSQNEMTNTTMMHFLCHDRPIFVKHRGVPHGRMQIFVEQAHTGKTLPLNVDSSWTIGAVKHLIKVSRA